MIDEQASRAINVPLYPNNNPGAVGIYPGPSLIIIVREISLIKTPKLHAGFAD